MEDTNTIKLEVSLLGTPVIKKDGKEVFFSYNKVNSLVYYILMRGTVMRDELSGLLWSDKSDVIARKNLRNAIYEAKKVLGADTFISPRKAIVQLNPRVELTLDVAEFEKHPEKNLALYKGDFLQGYFIKDSVEYEAWYLSERNRLRSLYMDTIRKSVINAAARKDYGTVERYGQTLIDYNPYEEEFYSFLLQAYCERGKTQEAMDLYDYMKALFKKDLQQDPPEEIEAIILKALHKKDKEYRIGSKVTTTPIGRKREMDRIMNHMWSFLRDQTNASLMIMGDTGSGKSSLKNALIDRIGEEVNVIQTNCYQLEKHFLLHPWMAIIEGLIQLLPEMPSTDRVYEDIQRIYRWFPQIDMDMEGPINLVEIKDILKIDAVFHSLGSVLDVVSRHKKLVIVFEDIHWLDSLSLSLLSTFILRKPTNKLMFILTGWESKEKDYQHFLNSVALYKRLEIVKLEPLSTEFIRHLLEAADLEEEITDDLVNRLQADTGGNLFFLAECIEALKTQGSFDKLTTNMEMLFKSNWLNLTVEEEKILTFLSLFYNGAPLSMISEYMQLDELCLLERLEGLEGKHFLTPIHHLNEITYKIEQHKMKEFIHKEISPEKWKVMHAYLGKAWEKRLNQSHHDIEIYPHLIYHFSQAGDLIKMGHYKLKNLTYYLNFSHELFPVLGLGDPIQANGASYFTEEDTLQYLKEIDDMMTQIRQYYGATPEVGELELSYLHIKGRYFIREGNYEIGVRYILELIEQASEMRNRDYALMGYKQMIYYDIQIGNAEDMKTYLEIALDLAVECNYHKEVGILLRLKGLNMIMQGRFDEAERLLNESIATFMVTQNVARRYALNIAAAYNYIGEIRRSTRNYEEALIFYKKAMDTCFQQQAYSSWVVFCCNAGIAAYSLERFEVAEQYFVDAYELFSKYDFYWRRAIVESYLALLAMRKGMEDIASMHLHNALRQAELMNNPQEYGYINMVIAMIKANYKESQLAKEFDEPLSSYCKKALQQLNVYRDAWAHDELEGLLRKDG